MRRAWSGLAALVLTFGWPAAPAEAWGSYTHVWIAERAYGVLVAREPWLAAHRDAFLWGAVAADLDEAPDLGHPNRERTHADATVEALRRAALAEKSQTAEAFALGWAVHVGAEAARRSAFDPAAVRQALSGATPPAPEDLDPLIDWAVDAALVPRGNGTLFTLYRSTVLNAGTPSGAPLLDLLDRVLGLDDGPYMAWARLQAEMSGGSIDRYLELRARFERVAPWADALRAAPARQALGDLTPVMTHAVEAGLASARATLAIQPPPGAKKPAPQALPATLHPAPKP